MSLDVFISYDLLRCIADDDIEDSDSDSSIEVINDCQASYNEYHEEKSNDVDGSVFDYGNDSDDDDSITGLDLARQCNEVTMLAEKQQRELSDLLATLEDNNKRIMTWASSCKPPNGKLSQLTGCCQSLAWYSFLHSTDDAEVWLPFLLNLSLFDYGLLSTLLERNLKLLNSQMVNNSGQSC